MNRTMNSFRLRSFAAITMSALLSACGAGQPDSAASAQLASSVTSVPAATQSGTPLSVTAAAPVAAPPASAAGPAVAVATVSANMPAPDCAAEGCAGLRIIDGNAEAYRLDAMRRAAGDAAQS